MAERQHGLTTGLSALDGDQRVLNQLFSNQQTLAGDMDNTRLNVNAQYYHYLAWFLAAATLGALTVHQLSKSR